MNILHIPQIRVVIVVIITTTIAIGIGLLMSRLLTPPPKPQKKCAGDTHLDENTNKCVPNCQDGYKNDPLTGECVINCPDNVLKVKDLTKQFEFIKQANNLTDEVLNNKRSKIFS